MSIVRRVDGLVFMFLIWRLVNFPAGHPRVAALVRTVSIAASELLHFLVVFAVFQVTFAVVALEGYGGYTSDFENFGGGDYHHLQFFPL
jgi:hypothetical protein